MYHWISILLNFKQTKQKYWREEGSSEEAWNGGQSVVHYNTADPPSVSSPSPLLTYVFSKSRQRERLGAGQISHSEMFFTLPGCCPGNLALLLSTTTQPSVLLLHPLLISYLYDHQCTECSTRPAALSEQLGASLLQLQT